jgi:ribosomal protein S18 acetylase RimI-like enzyme
VIHTRRPAGENTLQAHLSYAISRRPAAPDDEPFLFQVYASTRADELAAAGWPEEQKTAFLQMQFRAQSIHYRDYFLNSGYEVILLGDVPIGRMFIDCAQHEIRVVDIGLLPEYRNRGIGGGLMRDVLNEASRLGKPVRLHVETYNAGAFRFYQRLGFAPIAERGLHIEMECPPSRITN